MGLQQSKTLDKKPSRSKSSLSQKQTNSQQILEFASQLNHLVSLNMDNQSDRYDYLVFKKIPFSGKFSPLPMCQRASFAYDSVFICYDCSNDPHAYLCQQCFQKGKHQGHRFSVFPNNAGWTQIYCRCGDYQYMKKGTICQEHKQVKIMPTVFVDPKDKKVFSLYFDEIFKTLFSLLEKQRGATNLLNAFFMYLQKSTQNNLLFSKTLCEFLLQKNSLTQHSNLFQLVSRAYITNTNFFRNISFATEYKVNILREILLALNEDKKNVKTMSQVILNMDGKMEILQKLAKQEKLILGLDPLKIQQKNYKIFYDKLIQNDFPANEIWKSIIQNKLVKNYDSHENIISKILQFLYGLQKDKQLKIKFLQQLLECDVNQSHQQIIAMLMMLWPQWFLPTSGKSNKTPVMDKNLQLMFANFYQKIFLSISTNSTYQVSYETFLLLLPFFSFGEQFIKQMWQEMQRRINILQKSKEKAVIRNGSMNFFTFLTKLLRTFYAWQHQTIQSASTDGFKSYSHDNKKLIERLLKEQFAKKRKIFRPDMLKIVDEFTQKQRNLATEVIKKVLRYNTKKGKYYYVGDRLGNNMCNYQQLQVGAPIKLSEWQQIVVNKIFTEKVYMILPKLIKIAQRGLMQDMEMVKTVSNLSIGLSLINKKQKSQLKQSTRNFIKQISDVSEDVYYILAAIRDRFELDMDDLQEQGQKGRKKQKLDLITEIRDKKYRQMKQRQDKILKQWLKHADEADDLLQEDTKEQNFCHICKQKPTQTNRLVYLCNFTRNNVVSTLLKSQVTDLDMNICLHKVHEQCYDKVMNKRHCPLCKFQVNCYIPEKPLNDESYTKNWLRNFENIVTRINLESGKSFSSDWATIFLTYLVFSRSFRVLLKNTQIQQKQLNKIDQLLMIHYKNQLAKWPQLAKQAIKRAQKTVKGQVARESNIKKNVKSLTLDLVLQEITQQPFKNEKRIQKKIRQLINFVGQANAQKIVEGFQYCRNSETIKEIISQSISEDNEETTQLFKLKQLPQSAKEYLQKTTILCPMCNKYQSTTWQCLFCDKVSCGSCINDYSHVERDHRGSSIILYLNDAQYKLVHQNREVQRDSLYRNQYQQGWKRNNKPQGWKCCTKEMQVFFENILHSRSIKKVNNADDNSDDGMGGTLFGRNTNRNQRRMEQNQDQQDDNQDQENHDEDQEQQDQQEQD